MSCWQYIQSRLYWFAFRSIHRCLSFPVETCFKKTSFFSESSSGILTPAILALWIAIQHPVTMCLIFCLSGNRSSASLQFQGSGFKKTLIKSSNGFSYAGSLVKLYASLKASVPIACPYIRSPSCKAHCLGFESKAKRGPTRALPF